MKLLLLVADRWHDYALLDCGGGQRLERWGSFTLIRPDPQVIWPPAQPELWRKCDAVYERHADGGGRWIMPRALPESWRISYGELQFKVRPTGFKHTGLFPEQAVHWDWCSEQIRQAGRPIKVLNLFGYTGAATVAAAAAGAAVCHVDAARGMVQWCRENVALSGLAAASVRYIVDDCRVFVRREARRKQFYDAIIMDPPSYGRGQKGEVWKLEDHLAELLKECAAVLSPRPLFWLINAYTTGLSPLVLQNLLQDVLEDTGGELVAGELALPVEHGRRILPCGVFARWRAS